jgi:hypothetical protein
LKCDAVKKDFRRASEFEFDTALLPLTLALSRRRGD